MKRKQTIILTIICAIIGITLTMNGVKAAVTLTNTTTQYNLSNGLIKVSLIENEYNEILAYNESNGWVVTGTFDLREDAQRSLNNDFAIEILEEENNRVILNVSFENMGNYNFTMNNGEPHFYIQNTTDLSGLGTYYKTYYRPNNQLYSYCYAENATTFPINGTNGYYINGDAVSYTSCYNPENNYLIFSSYNQESTLSNNFGNNGNALDTGWEVAEAPNYITLGTLDNIDLTTISGNTATDYYWDNWTWTATAPTDYVRYWDFNEGTGTTADDKGSDDADLTAVSTPPWAHGKQNWGTNLDGTADYWYSNDFTTITDDTVGTISVWARIDDDNNDRNFVWAFGRDADADSTWLFLEYDLGAGDDHFTVGLSSDGTNQWQADTAIDSTDDYIGEWVNIVLVQDGVEPALYLNGQSEALTFTTTTDKTKWIAEVTGASSPVENVTVGMLRQNGGDYFPFDGLIDELRIYSRNITTAEITALYGQGIPDCLNEDSGSCTYWNVTQTTSPLKDFAEATLTTSTHTETLNELSINSNYTTQTYTFSLITNDFSIDQINMTTCYNCYNTVPTLDYFAPVENGNLSIIFSTETTLNYTSINKTMIGVNRDDLTDSLIVNSISEITLQPVNITYNFYVDDTDGYRLALNMSTLNTTSTIGIFPYYGLINFTNAIFEYYNVEESLREYTLSDAIINNQSQTITLYTLDDCDAVAFNIRYSNDDPVIGANFQALKYFAANDSYNLVTSTTTDDFGTASLCLDLNNWYRLVINIGSSSYTYRRYITSTTQYITIGEDVDLFANISEGYSATFSFDNETNYSSLAVIDSSGLMNNASFIIRRITLGQPVANVCSISNFTAGGSFFLFCDMGNATDGNTYSIYSVATFDNGVNKIIYTGILSFPNYADYDTGGLFVAWLVILTLTLGGMWLGGVKVGALLFALSFVVTNQLFLHLGEAVTVITLVAVAFIFLLSDKGERK